MSNLLQLIGIISISLPEMHMESLVRYWSTVLYGNEIDFKAFKAEVDAALKKPIARRRSMHNIGG
jgi:hypothetical protein